MYRTYRKRKGLSELRYIYLGFNLGLGPISSQTMDLLPGNQHPFAGLDRSARLPFQNLDAR